MAFPPPPRCFSCFSNTGVGSRSPLIHALLLCDNRMQFTQFFFLEFTEVFSGITYQVLSYFMYICKKKKPVIQGIKLNIK